MFETCLLLVGIFIMVMMGLVKFTHWGKSVETLVTNCVCDFENGLKVIPPEWLKFAIVICSAATLFLELTIIRIQGGYIQVLALLKNVSLLSCFLGLGVGFVLRKSLYFSLPILPLFLLFQVGFLRSLHETDAYRSLGNPFADEAMVGLASVSGWDSLLVIAVVILIFFLNALTFAPLGRLTGNLMGQLSGVIGYRYNLLGSILGIGIFNILSYQRLGGPVWLLIFGMLMFPFFKRWNFISILSMGLLLLSILVVDHSSQVFVRRIYTPYQTLQLVNNRSGGGELSSNSLYYQRFLDLSDRAAEDYPGIQKIKSYYDLPFKILGAAESVLIIGSGAGNDVAAAVRGDIKRIKALEIDPVILEIGRSYHPESPYSSEGVVPVITDARAFMKRSKDKFDGIVYGLVDSHALLSGRNSGLRLDSYVYTLEAFKEARALLKPNGILVLSFVNMSQETGKKLFLMLKEAFEDRSPSVLRTSYDTSLTFIAGRDLSAVERFAIGSFEDISEELSDSSIKADIANDDWPYFYMPRKVYPFAYFWLWVPLIVISALLFRPVFRSNGSNFDWCSFFLGAAFMLIETKAFTELALVWGSTFSVTTFVLLLVLFLGVISNEVVLRRWRIATWVPFLMLFLSLVVGIALTFYSLAGVPLWVEGVLRGGIITGPLFFAGICFSHRLENGGDVSLSMSANLLGAILGGVLEYTSMISGFRFLYVIAFALYLLAFVSVRSGKTQNG